MEQLGDLNFGPRKRLFLSRTISHQPTIQPLNIVVGGRTLTSLIDFLYEPSSNSVLIKNSAAMAPGNRIEVTYNKRCSR